MESSSLKEYVVSYFQDKVVVIIGATGALGTLTARTLRAAGAAVRLIARSPLRVALDLEDLPIAAARIDERHELVAAFGEVSQG